jgi:purine nucleoside phosphorylase
MFQGSMSSRKTGYRHPEGRAGHIVIPDQMTEFNRGRIATMFAANTHFKVWASLSSIFDRDLH